MIKHTPGPWIVDGPPYNQIVWSSAENRVCFLAHSNGLDDEQDIATGRLIAAAPELLAALKAVERHNDNPGRYDSYINQIVTEAIAKAEGLAAPLYKGGE